MNAELIEIIIMASETRKQEEFAKALDEHRRIVFKVANTYCRESEDRADLAQEIAAQLWRAYPPTTTSVLFPPGCTGSL